MRLINWLFAGFACCVGVGIGLRVDASEMPDGSNVIWESPSADSLGSMPLGNGDVGVNLWVEQDGDLLFYISKVDAFDDKGILRKLGRVRLALRPNPFVKGKPFRQELVLKDGAIVIQAGLPGEAIRLRAWVDAGQPVIRVAGESEIPRDVVVSLDWTGVRLHRVKEGDAKVGDGALAKSGTVGLRMESGAGDRIVWAYRNVTSEWKRKLIAQKSAVLAEKLQDPLFKLTSGCLVRGAGFAGDEQKETLRLKAASRAIEVAVHVLSCRADSAAGWLSRLEEQASQADQVPVEQSFGAHRDWWRAFWGRSFISVESCGNGPLQLEGYRYTRYREPVHEFVSGQELDGRTNAFQLTQRYALERFAEAAANRGSVPSPFNGSIFTMDLPVGVHSFGKPRSKLANADARDWGTLPFFWQNTRHPGWAMLTRGDYDTMMPSFRLIIDSLEVSKDRARQWFGHGGAFMPEGIIVGGVAVFTKPPAHLTYHWLGTIEMTAMMCDYYEHTQEAAFLKDVLLPCADEFVKFYELHFPKRDGRGRMVMEPAGTVETYQPVTNPVTEVCGLRYLLGKLLTFDEALVGSERRVYWRRVLDLLPETPLRTVKGVKLLAPGEKYSGRLICETPELYAVWPFVQAALGEEEERLALGRQSFHVRQLSLDGTPDAQSWETGGWQSAPIWAAYLGLPREAARLVSINYDDRFPNIADNINMGSPVPGHPRARFPGFWETKMDYTPDNDHGAVCANALQSMLLQSAGKRIFLLPAWPEDWDVSFKLCAAFNTTVECVYRDGRVQSLKVTPETRLADVVDFSSPDNRIRTLVGVACADRNYLFGLPPMLDGLPRPGKATGSWLAKYGECLAGVRAAPWPGCVFKDRTLYVFGVKGGVPAAPAVAAERVDSKLLTENDDSPVSILKVEYDRLLEEFALAAVSRGALKAEKRTGAAELDFGKAAEFDRVEVVIDNPSHRRGEKKEFVLEALQEGGAWKAVYRGAIYGDTFSGRLEPVTARQVRLVIQAPVRQFELFAPETR